MDSTKALKLLSKENTGIFETKGDIPKSSLMKNLLSSMILK